MSYDEIDRVTIKSDNDWECAFVPWLEMQENNQVGTEDGVFVATIDPDIRVLRQQDEEDFVKNCVEGNLTKVTRQKLKLFTRGDIYHFGVEGVSNCTKGEFIAQAGCYESYKNATCCTLILNQKNGLEDLLNHLYSDAHERANIATTSNSEVNPRSRVSVQESGLRMRQMFDKYHGDTHTFTWEKCKKKPGECPDLECCLITDPEDSDFSDSDEKRENRSMKSKSKNLQGSSNTSREVHYGFGTNKQAYQMNITAKLTLNRIFNILWLLPHFYAGFHSSFVYFGTAHSLFPLHVEDALAWGLNYLHVGHPKLWIIIPPWATELLKFHLKNSGLHLSHMTCKNVLGHKVIVATTNWLRQHRIPYKIVVQRQGDLVILYPSSAHFGFNLGPNIAEAINIGTESWIQWGMNANKCNCMGKEIHVDMTPLVAAFRKDLLDDFLSGSVELTESTKRGLQLLLNEVCRGKKHGSVESAAGREDQRKKTCGTTGMESEETSFPCPERNCSLLFLRNQDEVEKAMIRHVKKTHRPVLASQGLLQKIKALFHEG